MRHRSGSNENQKTSLTGANTRRWEGMGRKSECGALVLKFQAHPIPILCSFLLSPVLIVAVAVSVIGVSLFDNQYPDYFGNFTASFMTLFRIAGSQSANKNLNLNVSKYSNGKPSFIMIESSLVAAVKCILI